MASYLAVTARLRFCSLIVALSMVWAVVLVCLCQGAAAQGGRGNQARGMQFEVLSLRPLSKLTNPVGLSITTQPSPTGFDSTLSLWQAIILAYGPGDEPGAGSVEVLNSPSWIGEFYAIKGKVSQADMKAWQNQGKDRELLRSAMRAALRDRCKLAIHEQPALAEVFDLVVGKRGPRLKPAAGQPTPPASQELPSGGFRVPSKRGTRQVWSFYGATMQDLVDFLRIMSGRTPVRDRTGLAGRYDFTIQQVEALPDENHIFTYPIDHLGLKVNLGKENRPKLVIDHIEKPTPN